MLLLTVARSSFVGVAVGYVLMLLGFMDDVMLHIMTRKIGDANTRSDGRVYDLLTYQQGASSDRGGVCFVLAVIC